MKTLQRIQVSQWVDVIFQAIDQISSAFVNGPGEWGLIPGRVIPKTQKIVLDASLLYTQHYPIYPTPPLG